MPYLVIAIDITKGRLTEAAHHDAELSAILQQTHSAMVMRALPQALFDTTGNVVGEVRYQENPPGRLHAMEAELARAKAADDIKAATQAGGSITPAQGDAKTGARTKSPRSDAAASSYPPAVHYPNGKRRRR